jgi:hypothetical protein
MGLFKSKQLDLPEVAAALMTLISSTTSLKKQFGNMVTDVNTFVTTPGAAGPVKDIVVTAISNTGAQVDWTAIAGATSYELQYEIVGDAFSLETITGIATNTYTLTGLTPKTTYRINIKAIVP